MLSRSASSIYWMSRYLERAENVARFIDTNLHMILDLPAGSYKQWHPLVDVTGDRSDFYNRYESAEQKSVINFLAFDKKYRNSMISCLCAARENARTVREFITREMWEQLNKIYLIINSHDSYERAMDNPHEFFNEVMIASHLFEGITNITMSRCEGWHFYQLGRMLERADKTSRIIHVKYFILLPSITYMGTAYDSIQWSSLLRSTGAFEMYLRKHGKISCEKVIDFLLLDRDFPRAVHFCIITAEESLLNISGTVKGKYSNIVEQRMGKMRAEMDYTSVDEIVKIGLHEYINELQTKLNDIDEGIFNVFFAIK